MGFPVGVCPLSLLQDSEKLSQVSSMVYMGYYISHRSSLSLSGWGRQQFPPHPQGRLHCLLHPAVFIGEKYEARQSPDPQLVCHGKSFSWPCWPDSLSSHRVRGFQAWLPILISGSFFKLQILGPISDSWPWNSRLPRVCEIIPSQAMCCSTFSRVCIPGDFGFSWSRIF